MKPIDQILENVEWSKVEGANIAADPDLSEDVPVATHRGILNLGPISMECFRLSNGKAVISEQGMKDFLEWLGMGAPAQESPKTGVAEK